MQQAHAMLTSLRRLVEEMDEIDSDTAYARGKTCKPDPHIREGRLIVSLRLHKTSSIGVSLQQNLASDTKISRGSHDVS